MKVLIHHLTPFSLAHGGLQIQIQRTRDALIAAGLEAEYLRWYDDRQSGDLVHFFGRVPVHYLKLAHEKKLKVVMAELLTQQGSRSRWRLKVQKIATRIARAFAPGAATKAFNWPSYQLADACIANTAWEKRLMHELFGAPEERLHVVPNGVEEVFFGSRPVRRGRWLVCTATITERKRVLELAKAAVKAKTPLWVVGKPYAENDLYYQNFLGLINAHPGLLRYEGGISDRRVLATIYREARGFVLLSTMETLSLSADEAAACETPLLLSDLPWARETFGDSATYCRIASEHQTALALTKFYEAAPNSLLPRKPPTWREVGLQFRAVYEVILANQAASSTS